MENGHARSLGGSGVDDLLLEVSRLGESESDLVGGELVVAVSDGINPVLHDLLVERVEVDLLVSSSVNGHSLGSAGDVGGEALNARAINIDYLIIKKECLQK